MYHMAQNVGRIKLWRIDRFRVWQGNVKFTIANITYFSESGIWLGKILVNDDRFTKVFLHQDSVLAIATVVFNVSVIVKHSHSHGAYLAN